MAANFFEQQDAARRTTGRLVVLFVLAVLAIIVSVDLLLAATLGYLGRDADTGAIDWTLALHPDVLVLAAGGTLLVVTGGSLYKTAQLRGGGRVVAEELGGRLLNPDTTEPSERQLLNVVEEMAIASGTPVPAVYLLDREEGINAFAAGFTPTDAVIGITRGTAERLTRDELQGVVAHEFSHILNGDMRLNIRLMGLLHGILIIGMLGYFLLRMTVFSGYRHRRSRQEGNALPLLALGAGLMAVGFFGTFFGNMIKAAVSRQREYLADASAVQFTRHPPGLAGALRKIGGSAAGARLESPNAPEASHMFFGRATAGLAGLFSTHPPLEERIRRVDPAWDGTFPEVAPLPPPAEPAPATGARAAVAGLAGAVAAPAAAPASRADSNRLEGIVAAVGRPHAGHLAYAARLMAALPPGLVDAVHEPYGSRGAVHALLIDRRPDVRERQMRHLAAAADRGVHDEAVRLAPLVASLDVRARLPLVDMALPALRNLTPAQQQLFRENVAALVRADDRIDLFEWSLHRILLHDLRDDGSRPAQGRVRYRSVSAVSGPCVQLLSTLAHAGHRGVEGARTAFARGRDRLALPQAELLPREACGLDALEAALSRLDEAAPRVKEAILAAAAACVAADRAVTATEAELLRAISASLGCPMPPLLDDDDMETPRTDTEARRT